MSAFLACFAAFVAFALLAERLAPGRVPLRAPPACMGARLAVLAWLYLAFFALSWRPAWAGLAAGLTVAVLLAVSTAKRTILREPLVFTDFALARQVVRHPRLYYVDGARGLALAAGACALAVVTAAWFAARPSLLPEGLAGMAAALALAAGVAALAVAFALPAAAPLLRPAEARLRLVPAADTRRFGLAATLALYARRWHLRARPPAPPWAPPATPPAFDACIVVQMESFRAGSADLPNWSRAQTLALRHGRLAVPAYGAYTMRSEFAVLTGLDAARLDVDRYDPFLTAPAYAGHALPRALRRDGWHTLFAHPHPIAFFGRDRVMPALGFAELLGEDAFAHAARRGPYIADTALAETILARLAATPEPLFVFAVTMENHGPWKAGRLPGIAAPAAQYDHHRSGADAMIGRLLDALAASGRRVLLCAYGDHAPHLPDATRPRAPFATDYALVPLNAAPEALEAFRAAAPGRQDMHAAGLGRMLAALLGYRAG